jgi:hypothetical protein
MTVPLAILAFFAMALGIGTPAWPWFRAFLDGRAATFDLHGFAEPGCLALMGTSTWLSFWALGLGWWLYGDRSTQAEAPDALRKIRAHGLGLGCATSFMWMSSTA